MRGRIAGVNLSGSNITIPPLAHNGTESTILATIRDNAPISRSRIAEPTGLPHAAISRAAAKLLERQVVMESQMADTQGPRRKRGLTLNGRYGYVVSVEYGARGLEGAVVDLSYRTRHTAVETIPLGAMPRDEKIDQIVDFLESMCEMAERIPGECIGFAVVDPGCVDSDNGRTVSCATMDNWCNVPIVEILQKRLNAPVLLPNSMAAKVRAVDRLEVEGDVRNLLYVEYGDGITCGMKLRGEYIVGESNVAGELGHLRITDRHVPCRCGSVGCLEAVAALPGLARNVKEALTDNTTTQLAMLENLTGTDVLLATGNGDRLGLRVVEEAFDYLGRAVAGVVNILDPSMVILDNRLTQAGDDAVNSLLRSLTRNISPFHAAKLKLAVSKIESHLGAIGGGVTVIDRCLEN